MLATPFPAPEPERSNVVQIAPRGDRRKPGTQPVPEPVTPRLPVIDTHVPDDAA